jgi:hypothetical protein
MSRITVVVVGGLAVDGQVVVGMRCLGDRSSGRDSVPRGLVELNGGRVVWVQGSGRSQVERLEGRWEWESGRVVGSFEVVSRGRWPGGVDQGSPTSSDV